MVTKTEKKEEKKVSFGRQCKEIMVNEVCQRLGQRSNLFLTTFAKIGVTDIEKLRKDLSQCGTGYIIVKKAILKMVLEELNAGQLSKEVNGPLALAYGGDDLARISKILVDYAKNKEGFKLCAAMVEGNLFDAKGIRELAIIPSRDILLAQVIAAAKSPVTGLTSYLSGLLSRTVFVLRAIAQDKEKKEENKL